MDKYSYIANAHSGVIDDMYQSYKADPNSVDVSWQRFFEGFEFSLQKYGENGEASTGAVSNKELAVRDLIHAYRSRGHLKSDTNPVRQRKDRRALLDIEDFGLTKEDLDTEFECGNIIGIGKASLKKIVASLKDIYEGTVGFEYMYIRKPNILEWFKEKVEREALNFNPPVEEKKQILSKLNEAVVFENFLHTKYLGQKRFSLEGGETTIPALDAAINKGAELGVQEVVMGMAHRGRLNVLVNIMGKTYEQVFNEFEGGYVPDQTMGDGDVKYHMGFSSQIVTPKGHTVDLKLAPNPSHLEAVNPVVEGFARAKIDGLYENDNSKIMPILIHGDAAIAGQGIGYELVQMSKLDAYSTGGTIHFVINNQVGFTTDFDEARSSIYCTDLAKTVDAPVLHVNGDNPEAVVFCMKMAVEYRQKFKRDIFVDMVCYRRHGHNESDEPKFTQPSLYNLISKHANPREVYNKSLIDRGDIDAGLAKSMDKEFKAQLQDRLNQVKQDKLPYTLQQSEKEFSEMRLSKPEDFDQSPDTSISLDTVKKVGEAMSKVPKGFKPLKQIEKVLKQRKEMFFDKKELNWAAAEMLAYGSMLLDNNTVRISGQDTKRGTFSHRHAVVRDMNTNEAYSFLDHIEGCEKDFKIYNSLLSEFGCMGFEFGYAMADPNAVVIWEAQFGDFANGAQVMVDQFISCSYTKWRRMNGLVLLLPHGYEGQGPEHSNARPERYLQLASGNNMYICNLTTPANYFHMIRRQLAMPFRMPCILMSPKSLFRHPLVMSKMEEFTKGKFREVIGDDYAEPKKVKKVLLCNGKVYFDLLEKQQADKRKDVAIIRVEQLHPFPKKQVLAELKKYKVDMVYWVQEEPENMGAWSFILRVFREVTKDVISRKAAASPATGYSKVHKQEQENLVNQAFTL
ncbi:2-oxoglutarate dehydrogenase E1 component [Reichenbachiella faecimaris]|uniref:oxoglutarate dehydrogenase (succinyl-transferring) n=1 Tax=Reichenbachiella faecimaris TaxID=692418 RepID=A0A1W2GBC7_REIFA|nr:2-oxoglutarate dehydrogenase E1 component [Reichenbachiella faecimaris]SMD33965.1 2-oxoglutarate dehydrogenase E1 component [Reichenbachiella faecimaris]